MHPTWMITEPTPPPPDRAEVVIVGGGLAGLALAANLAPHARVVLLESRPGLGHGASGRTTGLATQGLPENLWRVADSLGNGPTGEILRMSRDGLHALHDLVPVHAAPLHLALQPREVRELEQSAAVLEQLGLAHTLLDASAACAHTGGIGFLAGLRVHGDGHVDPQRLVAALVHRARSLGAALCTSSAVTGVDPVGGDLVARTDRGDVRCDALVLAGGAALAELEPWLTDKLVPVREHALRTAPVQATVGAGRAQLGYVGWRQHDDGSLVVSGCRWATPHLEVYETDDTVVSEAVLGKVRQFLQTHLPAAAAAPIVERWARITTHTCDGLPILGPLPGDPTRVVCTGFQGFSIPLALAAAQGVARGLLTGRSDLPDLMSPGRFL